MPQHDRGAEQLADRRTQAGAPMPPSRRRRCRDPSPRGAAPRPCPAPPADGRRASRGSGCRGRRWRPRRDRRLAASRRPRRTGRPTARSPDPSMRTTGPAAAPPPPGRRRRVRSCVRCREPRRRAGDRRHRDSTPRARGAGARARRRVRARASPPRRAMIGAARSRSTGAIRSGSGPTHGRRAARSPADRRRRRSIDEGSTRADWNRTGRPSPASTTPRPGVSGAMDAASSEPTTAMLSAALHHAERDADRAVRGDLLAYDAVRTLGGEHEVHAERPAAGGDVGDHRAELGEALDHRLELVDDEHEAREVDVRRELARCRARARRAAPPHGGGAPHAG